MRSTNLAKTPINAHRLPKYLLRNCQICRLVLCNNIWASLLQRRTSGTTSGGLKLQCIAIATFTIVKVTFIHIFLSDVFNTFCTVNNFEEFVTISALYLKGFIARTRN